MCGCARDTVCLRTVTSAVLVDEESSSSLLTATVLGGVIGAAICLIVLGTIILLLFCKRRSTASKSFTPSSSRGSNAMHHAGMEMQTSSAALVTSNPSAHQAGGYSEVPRSQNARPASAVVMAAGSASATAGEGSESEYDTTLTTVDKYQSVDVDTKAQVSEYTQLRKQQHGHSASRSNHRSDYDMPIS